MKRQHILEVKRGEAGRDVKSVVSVKFISFCDIKLPLSSLKSTARHEHLITFYIKRWNRGSGAMGCCERVWKWEMEWNEDGKVLLSDYRFLGYVRRLMMLNLIALLLHSWFVIQSKQKVIKCYDNRTQTCHSNLLKIPVWLMPTSESHEVLIASIRT